MLHGSSLMAYDPAMVRANYRPFRVTRTQMTSKIMELLPKNRAITVSGIHHNDFNANSRIGKTYTMINELIPKLRCEGLKKVNMISMPALLDFWDVDVHYLDNLASIYWGYNIMIIDEVHNILPTVANGNHFSYQVSDKTWNDLALLFWDEVDRFAGKGGKSIFITAFHPLDNGYKAKLFNNASYSVLTAPLIELDDEGKYFREESFS